MVICDMYIIKRQAVQRLIVLLSLLFTLTACEVEPFCLACEEEAALIRSDSGISQEEDASDDSSWIPDGEISRCVLGAEEICNGLDDDCDGLTDDGFDLTSDPRHCGACNNECLFLNADSSCEDSKCVMGECYDDYADLDPDVEGCEYQCPVFPPQGGEECNGIDDDCDGEIDESEELLPPDIQLCVTTRNTPCEGTTIVCEERENVTTWYCDYDFDVEFDPSIPNGIVDDETLCDEKDGDCDGVADDPFPNVGEPCTRGQGECVSRGEYKCNDDEDEVVCDAPDPPDSEPELCNGLDDDCDGETDEDFLDDDFDDDDDMVLISDAFWIDIYEASRPTEHSETYSCTVAGRQPWVNVNWNEAKAACEAVNKRLCSASEWQTACENGSDKNAYPYGSTFKENDCNGKEYDHDCDGDNGDNDEVLPTGTAYGCPDKPSTSKCVTPSGVFDLSGNVMEWVSDPVTVDTLTYRRIRGGSIDSVKAGLTCQNNFKMAEPDLRLETLGFRCCRDK